MDQHKQWQSLLHELRECAYLRSMGDLLDWDQGTYMPKKGSSFRGEQVAFIHLLRHTRLTSPKFRDLLSFFINVETGLLSKGLDLSQREAALIYEVWKDYQKAICLPAAFIEEYKKFETECNTLWQEAKVKNDLSLWLPSLEKMMVYKRQEAQFYPKCDTLYDALLNQYEPGLSLKVIKPLFQSVQKAIIELLATIQRSPLYLQEGVGLKGPFEKARQMELAQDILKSLKVDLLRVRLDESVHAFSLGINPCDVRLTTNYNEKNLFQMVTGLLHELGHGIYEMGLDPTWFGTPLSEACSVGMHESQSRFFENMVGRDRFFWDFLFQKIQKRFPSAQKNSDSQECWRVFNAVRPSLIRTASDEVTYNLHIIIRTELETMMINDRPRALDLVELWNKRYEDLLGLRPQMASQGILQDIHWSVGAIGYFPTYTMGNLYAAHWNEQLEKELPDYEQVLRQGNIEPFIQWFEQHIYRFGREKSAETLLKEICGVPLSETPFINYLKKRYHAIYC